MAHLFSPQNKHDPVGAIFPLLEMGAYEALWTRGEQSYKRIASLFASSPGAMPSQWVDESEASDAAHRVLEIFKKASVGGFNIRFNNTVEYPRRIRDADYPVELFYYQGFGDLLETPCVSVVGTRDPSQAGLKTAHSLSVSFIKSGWTVVSGLARGIDTQAHRSAIDAGGNTIAIIGTPLSVSYPKENSGLQRFIADQHLVISAVPTLRYYSQDWRVNRFFFPERNILMAALSSATVIVEASDTSGTLTQARAAIKQGRKLFIMENCLVNKDLKWPKKYLDKGAVVANSADQILACLENEDS